MYLFKRIFALRALLASLIVVLRTLFALRVIFASLIFVLRTLFISYRNEIIQ